MQYVMWLIIGVFCIRFSILHSMFDASVGNVKIGFWGGSL